MNSYISTPLSSAAHEREKKRKIRMETAAWQRIAAGVLVLIAAINTVQCGVIKHMDAVIEEKIAEVEQLTDRYNNAVSIERAAVQAYGDLLGQVTAEREARAEQAAAYQNLSEYHYIGECTITAYCPCEECCGQWSDGLTATGIPAEPGTVAVDPDVIPLGSTVVIDGQRYLTADTGVTGMHVDIAVATHEQAEELGVRTAEVWVVES